MGSIILELGRRRPVGEIRGSVAKAALGQRFLLNRSYLKGLEDIFTPVIGKPSNSTPNGILALLSAHLEDNPISIPQVLGAFVDCVSSHWLFSVAVRKSNFEPLFQVNKAKIRSIKIHDLQNPLCPFGVRTLYLHEVLASFIIDS
jgi:hypothetical protein